MVNKSLKRAIVAIRFVLVLMIFDRTRNRFRSMTSDSFVMKGRSEDEDVGQGSGARQASQVKG